MRPYPKKLKQEEQNALLEKAEHLLSELLENNIGGFSGVNRPYFILNSFKEVIEEYGARDVGLNWSHNDLMAHPDHIKESTTNDKSTDNTGS